MTSWSSARASTAQAEKDRSVPAASCRACASVEGFATAQRRIQRSSLKTQVV
jgi:hypothetical protein